MQHCAAAVNYLLVVVAVAIPAAPGGGTTIDVSELLLTISPSSGVRHQHRGLAERAAPQGARGDRQRRDLLRVGERAMPAQDAVAGERHRKLRKKYVLSHISFQVRTCDAGDGTTFYVYYFRVPAFGCNYAFCATT